MNRTKIKDFFPEKLRKGYHDFVDGRYSHERSQYRELAEKGQKPETMIIACCDSRTTPETIFNVGPGELFVVRNVANLVPPCDPDGKFHSTAAALEFAVQALKVKNIIVMGHGKCGGINAALSPGNEPLWQGNFIGKWINMLAPLAKEVNSDAKLKDVERQTVLEHVSIRNSIRNLRSFPDIKLLEEQGKLALHGVWFDISTGQLWILDEKNGSFSKL